VVKTVVVQGSADGLLAITNQKDSVVLLPVTSQNAYQF